jgi:hypothetical protein
MGVMLLVPSIAHADDIERCATAVTRGSEAAKTRKAYSEARTALAECSDVRCEGPVRAACLDLLAELDRLEPSVIVTVTGEGGKDIAGATVTIDGQPVAAGAAYAVNPGNHQVEVRASGYQDATMSFVSHDSEKNRALRVKIEKSATATNNGEPPRPVSPLTWVTGGLAVAGLVGFGVLGASGNAMADDARHECGPRCPAERSNDVKATWLLADISLIAGVFFGGVSLYTYLTR